MTTVTVTFENEAGEDVFDGINPNDGVITLREAIEIYSGDEEGQFGNEIVFAEDRPITLNPTLGAITIRGNVLINDVEGYAMVQGNVDTLFIVEEGANATFNGLTFGDAHGAKGSSIQNYGNLTVTDGKFVECETEVKKAQTDVTGGVIYNEGTLTLENATFSGVGVTTREIQSDVYGGVIYNAGTLVADVINIEGAGAMTLERQSSVYGSVLYNTGDMFVGSITIANLSTTTSGTQSSVYGGAIYNNGALNIGELLLEGNNVTTSGIQAYFYGGMLYNSGEMTIENGVVANNTFDAKATIGYVYGGAIYNSGTMTLADSTLTENFVKASGSITNVYSAGIYNKGSIDILNSIVVGNEVKTKAGKTKSRFDLCNASGGSVMNLAYSVYGTLTGKATKAIETSSGKTVAKVFKTTSTGAVVYENSIPVIEESGFAAGKGTLVGSGAIGDYYYVSVTENQWKSFTTDMTYAFAPLAADFGLAGGKVITLGANKTSRVADLSHFDIGAYAIDYMPTNPAMPVDPSMVDDLDFVTPETIRDYDRAEKDVDASFVMLNDIFGM